MSDGDELSKMKVVELRAELANRGLDTKGVKAVLVDRLKEAMEEESGGTGAGDTSSKVAGKVTENEAERNGEADEGAEEEEEEEEEEEFHSITEVKEEQEQEDEMEVEDPATKGSRWSRFDSDQQIEVKEEPVVKTEPVDESGDGPKPVNNVQVKQENVKQEVGQDTKGGGEKKDEDIVVVKEEERRGVKRPLKEGDNQNLNAVAMKPEEEPDFDLSVVALDWYDSDLNLIIDPKTRLSAEPLHFHGFGFVWAGARATYGFDKGKAFYEVKILTHCDVSHLQDEPNPNVVRVGWSVNTTSMQLGEEPLSYGYGGTAKASTDCKFKDYGVTFKEGDIVGAYLDMDGNRAEMSFTVNGEPQGVAYSISKEVLGGQALFPHILSKNCKFEVKFGGLEEVDQGEGKQKKQNADGEDKKEDEEKLMRKIEPWFLPLEGHVFANEVPIEDRVRGIEPPKKREDCEMLMMCGLPGCGKTVWANEHSKKHPEKKYNIFGTNNLIDKMKVMGLPRKRNYSGRWDVLIDMCTKCLIKLLDMGVRRRRNYILDQTNVYPTAQRRKMRHFGIFQRRAVVIVPTDEEFKKRVAKREKEEGKDVPDSAVLEMKANFKLPEEGDVFNEVIFVELDRTESQKLVDQYNKEGRDAGYMPPEKRFRPDIRGGRGGYYRDQNRSGGNWNRGRGGGGNWRDNRSGGGGRGSSNWRDNRGGGRGGGNSWRDNKSGGSWRDNRSNNWQDNRGYQGNRQNQVSNQSQQWHYSQSPWGGRQQQNYSSGSGSWNQGGQQYGQTQQAWKNYNQQYSGNQQQQRSWGTQQQTQKSWGTQQQQGWGTQQTQYYQSGWGQNYGTQTGWGQQQNYYGQNQGWQRK